MIPKKIFFTKGVGRHREKLASFEHALRDAGIAKLNIVSVSSIFPPGCNVIPKRVGLDKLKPGEITYVVMARNETSEPNRLIAASVGCAIPNNKMKHGYLSEHHCFGMNEEKAGDYAEDLAASMLASTIGIEFDADSSWDEKEELFKMSGEIVKTTNITKSAIGEKNGLWTTVVAAAVFLSEDNLTGEKTVEEEQKITNMIAEKQTRISPVVGADVPIQPTSENKTPEQQNNIAPQH
ncbi:MAG: arginine decarboxylase, pyruvoyl-dependent [Candidatus Micrarchaeota archaeon]